MSQISWEEVIKSMSAERMARFAQAVAEAHATVGPARQALARLRAESQRPQARVPTGAWADVLAECWRAQNALTQLHNELLVARKEAGDGT